MKSRRLLWLLPLVASAAMGACSDEDAAPAASGHTEDASAPPADDGDQGDPPLPPEEPQDAGLAMPDAGGDAGPVRLLEHVVAPKTADARVTTLNEDHYAYVTTAPSRPELIVWLTGSSGIPKNERGPIQDLAKLGYRTIGLRYFNTYVINGTATNDVCARSTDANCHGNVRLEALDGVNHTPAVTVTPENSIEVRLAKLLVYLAAQFPNEGWGTYVDGAAGLPRWSNIIVAGTSHGASAAGRISKVRALAGAVMSSGPFDRKTNGTPAQWTAETSMTPVTKVWGLSHSADTQYAQHLKDWESMKLPGAVTFVDGKPPPWGGSHRLASARAGVGHGAMSKVGEGGYPTVWKTILGLP